MNLPRLSRERLLLVGAVTCLALLMLDRLVLEPALNAWATRSEKIQLLQLSVDQGNNLLDQETRWTRWQEVMRGRLLPAQPAAAESVLLNRVDGWSRQAGLSITGLRPRWKEDANKQPLLELQVNGSGSMAAVSRFLYTLETSPVAIAVEQLELSSGKADGNPIGFDLRLTARCLPAETKVARTP